MCSINQESETKEQYGPPKIKASKRTRERFLEQFLWKEFYDEYLRYSARELAFHAEKPHTEYNDVYCKEMPEENKVVKEELNARYPVYCTTAITLWNNDGDPSKDFKKRYSITRPVNEQTTQFG